MSDEYEICLKPNFKPHAIFTAHHVPIPLREKVQAELQRMHGFFQVRKNIIYERARFNQRVQQADESVEHFITNLYQLAKYCEYGNLRDEMIRDRIVMGIRDSALSERLQLDPDLTLDKVKKLVRQREAVHKHQQFLSGKSIEGTMVEAVSKGKQQQVCTRCGKGAHPCQAYPAREAICHKKDITAPFATQSSLLRFQKSLTHWKQPTWTLWRNQSQFNLPALAT